MTDIEVGNRLTTFRKQLKLSQKEIAKDCEAFGLVEFQGGYSMTERGMRPMSYNLLRMLVVKHNLNAYWLLTGEGKSLRGVDKPQGLVTDIKILIDEIYILETRLVKAERLIEMLTKQVADVAEKV